MTKSRMSRVQEKAMFARMATAMLMQRNPNVWLETRGHGIIGENTDYTYYDERQTPRYALASERTRRKLRGKWLSANVDIWSAPPQEGREGGERIATASIERSGRAGNRALVTWFQGTGDYAGESYEKDREKLTRKQLMEALKIFARENPEFVILEGGRIYDEIASAKRHRLKRVGRSGDRRKTQTVNLKHIREREKRHGKK